MTITMTCTCGAKAVFDDPHGSYINTGGSPDVKGRVYRIEVMAEKWKDDHAQCWRGSTERPHQYTATR